MDIGQIFFLTVYSENILSAAPVQDLSQKTSYTELPAPPPPTDINRDDYQPPLSSRSSPNAFVDGCCSVSVTDQKQLMPSPTLAGRLQEVRK